MNYHVPSLPLTVADIVDEYAVKLAGVDAAIEAFKQAHNRMLTASCVQGVYVERVVSDVHVIPSAVRKNLRQSGWKAIYRRLQIARLASAKDKRLFEQTLADPPDLTLENAKATFGGYLLRPRFHALRALAECFVQLDSAYKSHSKVKIGVAGLPKRIILSSFRGYGSYGRDRFVDVLNALAAVDGEPLIEHDELKSLEPFCGSWGNTPGEAVVRGITVKIFQNGNAHVIFPPAILRAINLALAEFYGEVLPDAEDDDAPRRSRTAVAAKLSYYSTPAHVIDTVLDAVGIYKPDDRFGRAQPTGRVLEPSCGDGRILDAVQARRYVASLGVEVDPGRAAQARAKGHNVITGNFLERPATPSFDYVVMNPPFAGRHWRLHLAHARKFLKSGGRLVCILPASAWYDDEKTRPEGAWHDLPVASFAESGTNVPTGFVVMGPEK